MYKDVARSDATFGKPVRPVCPGAVRSAMTAIWERLRNRAPTLKPLGAEDLPCGPRLPFESRTGPRGRQRAALPCARYAPPGGRAVLQLLQQVPPPGMLSMSPSIPFLVVETTASNL